MSAHPTPSLTLPHRAAAVVYGVSAAVVLAVGWLLFALSEQGLARTGGVLLLLAGVAAAVAAVGLVTGRASLRFAHAVSASLVVAGAVTVVLLAAADGRTFVQDLLVAGGLPVLAGAVTWLVTRR